MDRDAIRQRATKARDWMFEQAFELWSTTGVHPVLGFHERLTSNGRPAGDETTRVRVQARQVFCFALARQLGWSRQRADAMIAHGLDGLLGHCRREDGLFGKRMSHAGGLADPSADLYDTAFALLALSWAARAGHARAADGARDVCEAIETHLRRPDEEGGYREALPAPATRIQNPHMHLFEASLAQYEALGDARALERARRIEALVEQRFVQPGTGALREAFAPDWGPSPDDRLEAGHQYEWVWLMGERARLDGQPVSGAAEGLYRNALSLTGPGGAVALEHELDGRLRNATERTWGLTEALKAHISRHEHGDLDAAPRIVESFDRLWERHIAPSPVAGAWIDSYGPDGEPSATDITAATGYHVYMAFAELMRLAGTV
jgi:mannose/cellobiose epimerase-like protein (N-acyl-D-glucosamine 2-epimerase family)